MPFISLSNLAAKSGRIAQSNNVAVTQSKRATGAVELGFRLSRSVMDETGIDIGDRVDILHDAESSLWMIKKIVEGGFAVAGQKNKAGEFSSCAIRLTLRPGFPRLSDDDDTMVKQFSQDSDTQMEKGQIIFKLGDE
ncbi:hypothetical protein [Serratia fonticola]|uniref:hypothetical protein n=1 Tax=Serratia fonticola TaxID=47917 RepID=UPI001C46FB56|nr:hypothetical protein [Serratia fonticola]QXN64051.1 hypothetical protein J8M99_08465 [Serratia fonticola]QXN64060.1 hypothetical protein J8M99_08515 [Serratia fonticola]